VMHPHLSQEDSFVEMFLDEARVKEHLPRLWTLFLFESESWRSEVVHWFTSVQSFDSVHFQLSSEYMVNFNFFEKFLNLNIYQSKSSQYIFSIFLLIWLFVFLFYIYHRR
jgi:hypothetical protein